MESRFSGIILVMVAVLVLTAAQLIIKNRLSVLGVVPLNSQLAGYLSQVARDGMMWISAIALIISSLSWYASLSRIPLTLAYPFAALTYPIIFLGSLVFLNETFTWQALTGNALVVLGVILVASASTA